VTILVGLCAVGNGGFRVVETGRFALAFYDKETGEGSASASDPGRPAGASTPIAPLDKPAGGAMLAPPSKAPEDIYGRIIDHGRRWEDQEGGAGKIRRTGPQGPFLLSVRLVLSRGDR